MAKTTLIKKEIDLVTSFLYDRKEVVTAPMWPKNTSELRNVYTSSNQPHHQKIYYRTIFSDETRTGSLDVDFSIAYGHYAGSGSSTGSYGLITSGSYGLSNPKFPVSESMAIYSQYRNMLYEQDKRKYLSDGKFRFYGLTDVYLGVYGWEQSDTVNTTGVEYTDKVNIPDVKSFSLNNILSLSSKRGETISGVVLRYFYFINKERRLFRRNVIKSGPLAQFIRSVEEIGIGSNWKDVSSGKKHTLAIKEDGTLWGWGKNDLGQLGLGYIFNQEISEDEDPIRISLSNDWEKVYAGYDYSFAINSKGELYGWGDNSSGILGTGGTVSEYYPTIISNKTWKKISIGNADPGNESLVTVFAIDSSNNLWGWGDNSDKKLVDGGDAFIYEPYELNSEGDWYDISCGERFVIAVKDNDKKLYGWGYSGTDGEYLAIGSLLDVSPDTTYSISDKKFLSNYDGWPARTEWQSVACGSTFTFAINQSGNNKLYCWGDNSKQQLGLDTLTLVGRANYSDFILEASPLTGWDKISLSNVNSAGAINLPNPNVESMVSDDIYVINLNRWNFRDKIDAGNWQLSLKSAYPYNDNTIQSTPEFVSPGDPVVSYPVTLIDDSVNLHGTEFESPMYDVASKGGAVYGIYSGSIQNGIHKSAEKYPYGLLFPENGTIILNAKMLNNDENAGDTISIKTRRTPAVSSGAFPYSSNADLLYSSMKFAMQSGNPFIANTVETKIPTYCFIRINNEEFNYTTNRTKYQKDDSFLLKDKFRTVPYPFVYITTIGLYNDSDDLLAVAKLSRPILKTPSTELVIKVKLDI